MPESELVSAPPSWAVISENGLYRYTLGRRWGDGPAAVFIGLNPSTADATKDDPTIRRCVGFARDWGYGALVMVNLFAFRATSPRDMMKAADPVGPGNDYHLLQEARQAGIVVCAWGMHGSYRARWKTVMGMLQLAGIDTHYLSCTANEQPGHPLYLPKDTKPKLYERGINLYPVTYPLALARGFDSGDSGAIVPSIG